MGGSWDDTDDTMRVQLNVINQQPSTEPNAPNHHPPLTFDGNQFVVQTKRAVMETIIVIKGVKTITAPARSTDFTTSPKVKTFVPPLAIGLMINRGIVGH